MEILYSKSEAKVIFKNNIIKEWQNNWDREVTGRHYYRFQEKAGCRNNKTEGIITRLRMRRTGITIQVY